MFIKYFLPVILIFFFCLPKSATAQKLEWGSYIGNYGQGAKVLADDSGNVYCTGTTSDKNLATAGASQEIPAAVYLLKFNKSGKRIWGTYYGYTGACQAIAFDKEGNIIITGYQKHDYHSEGRIFTTKGAYQENFNSPPNDLESEDVFIAKYTPAGKLLWATLYGGKKRDITTAITTDKDNNIYVAGHTYSDSGFASLGTHQTTFTGTVSGFIAKFASNGKREWGTYYGGKTINWINSIVLDQSEMIYIGGAILKDPSDANLYVTPGSFQYTYPSPGENIGYVAKFDNNGKRIWGTYYGGGYSEEVQGIAIDKNYNIFIVGKAGLGAGIATKGSYQPELAGWYDGFLAKFDSSGKRTWGTYIGGESDDGLTNLVLDKAGDVYISFSTMSKNKIAGKDAYQNTLAGDYDAAIFKFSNAGKKLWSTYFGGTQRDEPYNIAVDSSKNIYISGFTLSKDHIATKGSFLDSLKYESSDFIAKFSPPIKDTTQDTTVISVNESIIHNRNITVYPNPSQGKFSIAGLPAADNDISIYSILGQCVYRSPISGTNAVIDLSSQTKGVYIYKLKDAAGMVKIGKIILE